MAGSYPMPYTDWAGGMSNLGSQVANLGPVIDETIAYTQLKKKLSNLRETTTEYVAENLDAFGNEMTPSQKKRFAEELSAIKNPQEFADKGHEFELQKQYRKEAGLKTLPIWGMEFSKYKTIADAEKARLGEEKAQRGQEKVTSFIGEMQGGRPVGVPAGAPAPEMQRAFESGQMPAGQQPLPTPPRMESQFLTSRQAQEETIRDPVLAESEQVQSQIGLMKEDEKVRAAEEEQRRVVGETQRQAGLVSGAETQVDSYGRLAEAGVEPMPVIKSFIGTMPKTSQERDEQSMKLDKLDQDLRGAGSGTSDDIVKANTIAERRHTILDKHKKLLVTLKKAALYADQNDTENLNKMFALDPEKNMSDLESAGYDGSADPREIQLAYEDAVKQTPGYEKRVKEAEETVKILEKRGGSALASAGREATETVERESRDELLRELEMLKTTLSPALFYRPDVFYDVASKVASPETVKYIKGQVQGGKRIEEILSTPQTTETGTTSAGGGQYPIATSYIVTEYQRQNPNKGRPSQAYIDSKLQVLKARGVELE